jgi:hypothetical protein
MILTLSPWHNVHLVFDFFTICICSYGKVLLSLAQLVNVPLVVLHGWRTGPARPGARQGIFLMIYARSLMEDLSLPNWILFSEFN